MSVLGGDNGSPEILWKNTSGKVCSSRKEALDAFYEQMAWHGGQQHDLTLKDLVLAEPNPVPAPAPVSSPPAPTIKDFVPNRVPNPVPAAPILALPAPPSPATPAPLKMETVYEEEEEEAQSSRRLVTVGELLGNRDDYLGVWSRASSRTELSRFLSHRGVSFESKRCTRCKSKPLWRKTRCLVCGKLYCGKCVKQGMGKQVEGPKCVKCVGAKVDERYVEKKANTLALNGCSLKVVTQNFFSLRKKTHMKVVVPKNSSSEQEPTRKNYKR